MVSWIKIVCVPSTKTTINFNIYENTSTYTIRTFALQYIFSITIIDFYNKMILQVFNSYIYVIYDISLVYIWWYIIGYTTIDYGRMLYGYTKWKDAL